MIQNQAQKKDKIKMTIEAYQKVIEKSEKYKNLEKVSEFQEFLQDIQMKAEQHLNVLKTPVSITTTYTTDMDYARLKASQMKFDAYMSVLHAVKDYEFEAKRAETEIQRLKKNQEKI